MEVATPFDAALDALLTAWKARDDLLADESADDAEIRRRWVELDRARQWVRWVHREAHR